MNSASKAPRMSATTRKSPPDRCPQCGRAAEYTEQVVELVRMDPCTVALLICHECGIYRETEVCVALKKKLVSSGATPIKGVAPKATTKTTLKKPTAKVVDDDDEEPFPDKPAFPAKAAAKKEAGRPSKKGDGGNYRACVIADGWITTGTRNISLADVEATAVNTIGTDAYEVCYHMRSGKSMPGRISTRDEAYAEEAAVLAAIKELG